MLSLVRTCALKSPSSKLATEHPNPDPNLEMKNFSIAFAFVVLLPQALGIHCLICYSNTSWADCEKKLRYSHDCNSNSAKVDWVCKMQLLTAVTRGKTQTHYSKMCAERKNCDPKTCNTQSTIRNTKCEMNCCCEDNCNVGIPEIPGVSKASLLSPCTYVAVLLAFIVCTL